MDFSGFDLQLNGYGGVDFSKAGLRMDDVLRVVERLAAEGTTSFLPTIITASNADYASALPVLADAVESSDALPAIHLEGPFISAEDGAVGAHPKPHVQPPSIDTFRRLQDLARGHIKLVTLAPEKPGAIELIEYLVDHDIIVSLGHTLASSDDIANACKAGASCATHLGNGIPTQLRHTDNPIWSVLANDLTVMLIADGFHTPPDFIRAVFAAKGPERIILTSDAAPVAGLEPGEYEIFGTRVRLDPEGVVRNLNAPTLAGSAATLRQTARHFAEVTGCDEKSLRKVSWDNAVKLMERVL
ncbi:MAG: N-acetylglucosamine-6-phosphate deacetylase [Candidatus Sumerlaeota bacterium]